MAPSHQAQAAQRRLASTPDSNDHGGAAAARDDTAASATSETTDKRPNDDVPAVRFSSAIEEIAPNAAHATPADASGSGPQSPEVAADQLREYTKSLHARPLLQERRMNTFQFEAFSLPASRVPSREEDSPDSSRLPTPASGQFQQSPHGSPRLSAIASPPLTPSGSGGAGAAEKTQAPTSRPKTLDVNDPQAITPQASTSHDKLQDKSPQQQPSQGQTLPHRPASPNHKLQRSASAEDHDVDVRSHRRGMFGGGASVPVSRESSPSRNAASNFYSRPMAPGGDANDPYAKGRRPQQHSHHHNKKHIDPRFIFSRKKKKAASPPSSSKNSISEKRASGMFSRNSSHELAEGESASGAGHQQNPSNGSMSDLKRFFKGGKKHHKHKRDASPASSSRTGYQTPPAARSTQQLPFAEDHGLSTKYGKIGRVLGSGAGGSVKLMKRKEDNTVFAVKEFRARNQYETEKEYNKKVMAEFCVGSTLHHGNIIETLDIVQEKGRWYEVMEYAPFDLFATVMTGKMGREEIRCCFLQILNGVTYLHSLGLAHRDLKLDNVVISDKGIMKIIDFGSAHVFRYPFESGIVPAKGIVGSDPYLAPEVYKSKEYDAAAVDIWSLAIIFCCMTLRRFPWKLPQEDKDNSYKLFAAEPTPGHDPTKLVHPSRRHGSLSEAAHEEDANKSERRPEHKHEEPSRKAPADEHDKKDRERPHDNSHAPSGQQGQGEKKEIIKGPWRILRLLPRESRYIIWRMLDINPKTRATMEEILAEPWVADSLICQQTDDGTVILAEDHEHTLQPPSNPPAA
ncbi:Serine/threonine-protein kinase-like protein [Emericellopsis cladophorae]|uniref:non-specific serine/threonine protein kinase n=1 Tax=Emericellopsis cladophorae TaxID=2686198 RepID=A0A9P9Y819_9HYPO|nr:Serine/threonine-protein kinase-like protein [Emericellopsis cladophorae]KAI6785201.1 Serine/threonine-protein kinase-like protein [Emericellopsis cladophorae]